MAYTVHITGKSRHKRGAGQAPFNVEIVIFAHSETSTTYYGTNFCASVLGTVMPNA